MMTLDEAIKHYEDAAASKPECDEYQQLAKWLRELKSARMLIAKARELHVGIVSTMDNVIEQLKENF